MTCTHGFLRSPWATTFVVKENIESLLQETEKVPETEYQQAVITSHTLDVGASVYDVIQSACCTIIATDGDITDYKYNTGSGFIHQVNDKPAKRSSSMLYWGPKGAVFQNMDGYCIRPA